MAGVPAPEEGFSIMVLAPVKAVLVSPDCYLAFLLETPQWLV